MNSKIYVRFAHLISSSFSSLTLSPPSPLFTTTKNVVGKRNCVDNLFGFKARVYGRFKGITSDLLWPRQDWVAWPRSNWRSVLLLLTPGSPFGVISFVSYGRLWTKVSFLIKLRQGCNRPNLIIKNRLANVHTYAHRI